MNIYTSYFYQIRFFRPDMLPISTAIWDPKWFHDFKGQDYMFHDRRGVLNGVRCEPLHPGEHLENSCRGRPCPRSPETCDFLRGYRKQIFAISKDKFLESTQALLDATNTKTPVLIVHEAPDNPCSERVVLQEWLGCEELKYPIE